MKRILLSLIAILGISMGYAQNKLQEITAIGTTELCMAILVLIRDNRVKQFQCEEGVCYALCKS